MARRRGRPPTPDADLFFSGRGDRQQRRKDAQLCAQVREALSLALDELALGDVWVREVVPSPDAGHLSVVVVARGDELAEVARAIDQRAGHLRNEVAQAIHRKRTPQLAFVVLPDDVIHDEAPPRPSREDDDEEAP